MVNNMANRLIEEQHLTSMEKDSVIQHLSTKIETLEQDKVELETEVQKHTALKTTNGNFKIYLDIVKNLGLDYWQRRRMVKLLRTSQDTTDSNIVFRIGSLGSRFFIELTYPQLTGLIKLIVLAFVGITTGSTIWFRIQDFIPWL